jgi:hypothetical protein
MILTPSFGFCALRTKCALRPPLVRCFYNYGQTPPAVGRKRFAPAPGKTTLLKVVISLNFNKRMDPFRVAIEVAGLRNPGWVSIVQ